MCVSGGVAWSFQRFVCVWHRREWVAVGGERESERRSRGTLVGVERE